MRVKDVKVVRGADVSSDHYLLLTKMSMGCKVQKGEKKAENVAIRTDRLKDREVRMKFQAKLLVKMNELGLSRDEVAQEAGVSVEDVWLEFKEGVFGAAVEVCGIRCRVVRWLRSVIQLMWKRGEVVEDWSRAFIVPLHKKGSKLACSNYRGISLLSIPSKVYAKILDSRLRSRTESMVMEVQGGFKSGRSCVDQIFTIRQLSEKILEKNKQMIIACVDLEKAYDKVCRENLWRMLVRYKLGGHLLRAIQ